MKLNIANGRLTINIIEYTSFVLCHSVLDTESIQIIIDIDSRFRGNDTVLIYRTAKFVEYNLLQWLPDFRRLKTSASKNCRSLRKKALTRSRRILSGAMLLVKPGI